MKQSTRLTHPSRRSYPLAALLAGVLATIGCLLGNVGTSVDPTSELASASGDPVETAPGDEPTPPSSAASDEPTPGQPDDVLAALAQAEPLPRDRYDLAARLMNHPLTERQNQSGILGDWYKCRRRNKTARLVFPAQERLRADDLAVSYVDLRLVVQLERLAVITREYR